MSSRYSWLKTVSEIPPEEGRVVNTSAEANALSISFHTNWGERAKSAAGASCRGRNRNVDRPGRHRTISLFNREEHPEEVRMGRTLPAIRLTLDPNQRDRIRVLTIPALNLQCQGEMVTVAETDPCRTPTDLDNRLVQMDRHPQNQTTTTPMMMAKNSQQTMVRTRGQRSPIYPLRMTTDHRMSPKDLKEETLFRYSKTGLTHFWISTCPQLYQDAQKALNNALQAFISACQKVSSDDQEHDNGQRPPPTSTTNTPPLDLAGMVTAALSNAIQGFGSDGSESVNNGSSGNPIILPIFIRT